MTTAPTADGPAKLIVRHWAMRVLGEFAAPPGDAPARGTRVVDCKHTIARNEGNPQLIDRDSLTLQQIAESDQRSGAEQARQKRLVEESKVLELHHALKIIWPIIAG